MVQEFIASYAKLLVNYPEEVRVTIGESNEECDEIIVYTNPLDTGKLIGKEGKMINAIKTVISGCKAKGGKNYRVNVKSSH
ncbi:MAG TPA: KH domain-containing protein [Epsilonproteobacteria bacterium]|nr:KH domain-containing protein [Campylobacterota bacterium]